MQNRSPLVSVVVPSYNHERFIEQCIDSIFAQTFNDFELIVIDDGSSDGSRDVLNGLKNKYDFTLVVQENMGISRTLNKGIQEYALGKYFTFCASDDYWLPDKLEKQVSFMEQHPDIPMCYGKAYAVDEESNVIQKLTVAINQNLKGGYIFKDIILINFHLPVNYLFRKNIYYEVGLYRDDIFTEDFYMNLRISNKYQIGYIDDFLFCYRTNQNFQSKPPTIKTSISHAECINEYKWSEYYKEAMLKWHFRNFVMYSAFRKHKSLALKGMIQSVNFILNRSYLRSIVRLLFSWR